MFLFEVEAAARKKIPSQFLISARNATVAVFNNCDVHAVPHRTGQRCSGSHKLLGQTRQCPRDASRCSSKGSGTKAYIERGKGPTYLRSSKDRVTLFACCRRTSVRGGNAERVQEGKRNSFPSTKLLPLNKTQTSEIYKLWVFALPLPVLL